MTFLALAEVDVALICEEAFWGAIVVGEAICGEIFSVVFNKGEKTLSVNSRDLNESTNVVEIFRHRRLYAPYWSYQKHRKEKNTFQIMSTSVVPTKDPQTWE